MGRIRLADRIAHAMIEQDYGPNIMWGDDMLNDAALGHIGGRLSKHPLDRMIAALNALERAPDLFEKSRIHAHDSNGSSRVVRCFKLIGTPRPLPTPSPETIHDPI